LTLALRHVASAPVVWLAGVGVHRPIQDAFASASRAWGFEALQDAQLWLWVVAGPLAFVVAVRRGADWRRLLVALSACLLATDWFVTRAEALHFPQYAILWWLARPLGRWRIAAVPLAGVTDECLQWAWLDPARAGPLPDGKDMLLNALGAALGWAAERPAFRERGG
jgi:hypothetical protein